MKSEVNKEMSIKVTYDGDFPNTCSGTLTIIVDGEQVYSKAFCCESTGSVWFDDDWNDHIESGELIWGDDAKLFDEVVQEAVAAELAKHEVCCGGCV